jgi:transposase-like protein
MFQRQKIKTKEPQMKVSTKSRKKQSQFLNQKSNPLQEKLISLIGNGKKALDETLLELGVMLAETIMLIEREEISGSDYHPKTDELRKWAGQPGSVYIGDRKVKVIRPRLRNVVDNKEIKLSTYESLKNPDKFSEEILMKALRGLSTREYNKVLTDTANSFGVSPSSISKHIVSASSLKLQEFKERSLKDFNSFSIFIDTVHRGSSAFIVALGIDMDGNKSPLGFWEGGTENSDICTELLNDMESRGLKISKRIIWVTDGGKGVIKALKNHLGKKFVHVRCSIHKDRNIQSHLPKKFRKESHRRFRNALEQADYKDAKEMLLDFEKWLRRKNESAADSLLEAFDELLILHKLKVPHLLRKSLHTTNAIESMFSTVRFKEKNIKIYKNSKMSQRWLASILITASESFRTIKGYKFINNVVLEIENYLNDCNEELAA